MYAIRLHSDCTLRRNSFTSRCFASKTRAWGSPSTPKSDNPSQNKTASIIQDKWTLNSPMLTSVISGKGELWKVLHGPYWQCSDSYFMTIRVVYMDDVTASTFLGSNILVVRGTDEISHQASERVWFEAQSMNRSSSFLTVQSKYPSSRDIKDGMILYQRTGSTSLIGVGGDDVMDYCKGLKLALEKGYKTNEQLFTTSRNEIRSDSKITIPLVCVPTIPSYRSLLPSWRGYNDDYQAIANFSSSYAKISVYDSDVMDSLCKSYPATATLNMIANLFDITFNLFLRDMQEGSSSHSAHYLPKIMQNEELLEAGKLVAEAAIGMDTTSTKPQFDIGKAGKFIHMLGHMHAMVQSHHKIHDDEWLSFIDIFSNMKELQISSEMSNEHNIPQLFTIAEVLKAILDDIMTLSSSLSTGGEMGYIMKSTLVKALSATFDILSIPSYDYLTRLFTEATQERIKFLKTQKLNRNPQMKQSSTPIRISPSSILEDYIMLEEQRLKMIHVGLNKSQDDRNVMKESPVQRYDSLQLRVLQSDFVENLTSKSPLFRM